jgi:hypothetical protein
MLRVSYEIRVIDGVFFTRGDDGGDNLETGLEDFYSDFSLNLPDKLEIVGELRVVTF